MPRQPLIAHAMHPHRLADTALRPEYPAEFRLHFAICRQTDTGNLNDLISCRIQTGRLHIEDDNILLRPGAQKRRKRISVPTGLCINKIRQAQAGLPVGPGRNRSYGCRSDSLPKAVQNADQTEHIIRINDQPQESQRVLYLLTAKKLRLIQQHKWQPLLFWQTAPQGTKLLGKNAIAGVIARQDTNLRIIGNRKLLDSVINPLRFLRGIQRSLDNNRRPLLPAHRLHSLRIKRSNALGKKRTQTGKRRIKNYLRRTIILMQHNAARPAILLILPQHLFGMGPAPFINGLKIVAAKQEMAAAENPGKNPIFQFAGVLHLIDIHIHKTARPFQCNLRIRKQLTGAHDKIGEVQSMKRMKLVIIT